MTELIIYSLLAGMAGTGLGGLIGSFFRAENQKIMSLLLSFAAGIMLSVVCFDLLPASEASGNITIAVLATVLGVITIYFLNYLIDYVSVQRKKINLDAHHTSVFVSELGNVSKNALLRAGILMVLAIALHNFPEGLSIGSSYTYAEETGLILAIIIALHNIPEGMAIVVPLICGGMKKPRSVIFTALSGAPTILGALVGFWIGGISNLGLSISLGIASGAMIYIIFGEILPQAISLNNSKLPAFFAILGLLLGLALVKVF